MHDHSSTRACLRRLEPDDAEVPRTSHGEIAERPQIGNCAELDVGRDMPADQIGPELLDEMVADIRQNYAGPLQLARDLMRIEI